MQQSKRAVITCLVVIATAFSTAFGTGSETSHRKKRSQEPLKLTAKPVGPSSQMIESARLSLLQSSLVRKELDGRKYRLFSIDFAENGTDKPAAYRAVIYDYTDERTLVAEGDLGSGQMKLIEQNFQPMTNDEEFNETAAIVGADPNFADAFSNGLVKAYRAMPDVTVLNGTTERLVNVGLNFKGDGSRNEIVGISIRRGAVVRYKSKAPPASYAAPESCGIANAVQATTANGTPGQLQFTVSQGGTTLWEMTIVRPSASSGTRKSGIEIQNVKYKGKLVLKRGHAPVLNVEYIPRPGEAECGPYRDWQWQEGMFQTPTTGIDDVADGFRIISNGQIATSAMESGNDTGNFKGVAIYTQDAGYGPEAVLLTEMEAGWYRYVMEWRFAADGTIRPRYGFGATDNPCVCSRHDHHVYWRFDFDVVNPSNKVFQVERGRKFLKPVTSETSILRNYGTNRSLLVQNSSGDEAYQITPGMTDGTASYTIPETGATTSFGKGDFWILRYKNVPGGSAFENEIDDGFNISPSPNAYIQIDNFLNNESVIDQDIVVWYGAHFIHADAGTSTRPAKSPNVLSGDHVVGPTLRPVRW